MESKSGFYKKLKKHYTKRFKKLNGYLDAYIKTDEFEALHKLRIEIKKLSALFHLIAYCRQKPYSPETLKAIEKVFKLCGKLRTNKINGRLKINYMKCPAQSAFHEPGAATAKNKLLAKHKKYRKQILQIKHNCQAHLRCVSPSKLQQYIIGQVNVINTMASYTGTGQLHPMRKNIKEVLYIIALKGKKNISATEAKQLATFHVLEDAIGNWHDINKFIEQTRATVVAGKPVKIPVALNVDRKNKLALVEKELSTMKNAFSEAV